MGTIADAYNDDRTYYNCPVCGRNVYAYGDFAGTQCIGCPGYNIEKEEARRRAEEDRRRQVRLINEKNKLETEISTHAQKSQQKYKNLKQKLETNIKKGIYDKSIDLQIDKDNPIKKLEEVESEIYGNFFKMADTANDCYITGEIMEQTINKFEKTLKQYKDTPSFVPSIVEQYKDRAKVLKNFKLTFQTELFADAQPDLKVDDYFLPKSMLGDELDAATEEKYLRIFKKYEITSIKDLKDFASEDFAKMGIKMKDAIRMGRVVKGYKNIYKMSDTIKKMTNAIKTIKKAYEDTEKDIKTFIKSFKKIREQHKNSREIAEQIKYIANNLKELEKIITTENSAENFKGAAVGGGIGWVAGTVIGGGIGALIGGGKGAAIGGITCAIAGGIIGGFLGVRYNSKRYNVEKIKVNREGTKKALMSLSRIIIQNMDKKDEIYKDDDLKTLEDDKKDMKTSFEELKRLEESLSGIQEEIMKLEAKVPKLSRKKTEDIEKKFQEIMDTVQIKMDELKSNVKAM